MLKRSQIATAALCAGIGISGTTLSAHAQNQDLTAREKYDLAVELQEGGQADQALQRLRQIDPMDLSDDVRRQYYERLAALDPNSQAPSAQAPSAQAPSAQAPSSTQVQQTAVQKPAEPETAITHQLEAAAGMPASKAAGVYEVVLASAAATGSEKAIAKARLSQIKRMSAAGNQSAKSLIDEATAQIQSGDYELAKASLETAGQTGDTLGYYDSQRLQTRMKLVNERLAAQAQDRAAEAAAAEATAQAAQQEADRLAAEQSTAQEAAAAEAAQITAEAAQAEAKLAADRAQAAEQARVAAEQTRIAAEQAEAAEAQALSEAQSARVTELTSMGDSAFEAGQYDAALNLYQEAAQISGGDKALGAKVVATIEAMSAEASAAGTPIAETPEGPSLLDDYITRNEAIKDAYILRYQERSGAASRALDAGRYAAARDFVNASIQVLDEGRIYLSQSEYVALREAANTQLENIQLKEQQSVLAAEREATAERASQLAAQRAQLEEQRQAQVHELLQRALDLRKQGSYESALAKAKEALFIDPTDVTAQLMADSIEADMLIVRGANLEWQRERQRAYQQVDNLEAVIPYKDIITYPDNWPQITKQRLEGIDQSGGESAATRRAQQLLEDTPIATVTFEGMRLATVIQFLQTNTGANIVPNWPALELAGVDQDTPITLNMRNVSASRVLDLTLQQASTDFEPVSFSIEDGVVVISTETALASSTDVRIYDIRDLMLPIIDNFNQAPQFDLQNVGQQQGGGQGGGGGGNQNIFDNNNQNNQQDQADARDDLILNLLTLIRDTVGDPLEWVANGGNVSSAFELRGRMVIRTTNRNHSDIRQLLTDFREFRSIAISIEARILLVDESFVEEIGVDFDVQIDDIGGNFTPISIGQNSIELAQRGANVTPSTPARFSGANNVVGPQTVFTPLTGISAVGGGVPGARSLDFSVGFLDDLSVNLIVNATQANQRSVALTAPRVTFLNGTSATVTIAQQIAFISDLDVVPNAAAFDPDIGVVNSGVVLAVEGAVSADRRYVTMNVWPSLSSVVSPIRQVPFTGTTNTGAGAVVGGVAIGGDVAIEGFIEVPETTLTQVRTQVSVPDQGTLLLGGQRLVGEIEIEAGVPVLSKVPFLKRLFTNTSTVKDERTLLILVKPTILLQNEQEDKAFPGISNDPTGFTLN